MKVNMEVCQKIKTRSTYNSALQLLNLSKPNSSESKCIHVKGSPISLSGVEIPVSPKSHMQLSWNSVKSFHPSC